MKALQKRLIVKTEEAVEKDLQLDEQKQRLGEYKKHQNVHDNDHILFIFTRKRICFVIFNVRFKFSFCRLRDSLNQQPNAEVFQAASLWKRKYAKSSSTQSKFNKL